MALVQHYLLFTGIVTIDVIEIYGWNQFAFSSHFCHNIYKSVMVFGMADVKLRIHVSKPHRHGLSAMFSAPGIEMPVLQDVVT